MAMFYKIFRIDGNFRRFLVLRFTGQFLHFCLYSCTNLHRKPVALNLFQGLSPAESTYPRVQNSATKCKNNLSHKMRFDKLSLRFRFQA